MPNPEATSACPDRGRDQVADACAGAQRGPERAPRRTNRGEAAIQAARVAADVTAFLAAFALSYHLYVGVVDAQLIDRGHPRSGPYELVAALFAWIAMVVFWRLGLYAQRAAVLNLWELETALKGVVLAAAWFFAVLFFARLAGYSRLVVVGAILIAMPFVLLERRLLAGLAAALRMRSRVGRNVVICGCGATGRLLMKKIVQAPHLGYRVAGFLDDRAPIGSVVACRTHQTGQTAFRAPVLGRWHDWREVAEAYEVQELLVTTSSAVPERLRELLRAAHPLGIRVGVVPHLAELRVDQLVVEDLSAIPVMRAITAPAGRVYSALKRAFDFVAAALLTVLTSPVWLATAAAVKLDSPGPVLFRQLRVGLNGHPFSILKFRSMRTGAATYAPSPRGDVDPRITRIGRVLRTTGLDELPQLINVLRGEMSLVGPRPEMPFIVESYSELHRRRLEAMPGITGIWQLSADRHVEIHDNIEYDLYYVTHRSLTTDLLILFETLVFSIGQVARAIVRPSAADARPASIGAPELDDERYVVVALDQRTSHPLGERWQQFVPAAYALSDRWPVKLLVAGVNVAVLDELLAPTIGRLGTRGFHTEYVPYQGRAELRALVAGARLVITDLPHVAAWAREEDVDLLSIHDDALRLDTSSRPARDVLDALGHALPQSLPSAPHTRREEGDSDTKSRASA